MVEAVDRAVAEMSWLEASDQAMVALARKYAAEIDTAGDERLGVVGYLGQNLAGVLRSLGGSPAERRALNVKPAAAGTVASLRAARASRGREHGAAVVDAAASEADP